MATERPMLREEDLQHRAITQHLQRHSAGLEQCADNDRQYDVGERYRPRSHAPRTVDGRYSKRDRVGWLERSRAE